MWSADIERQLVEELRARHAAHTVILYGSHARGDASAESDVDVACFSDVEDVTRDARRWRGTWLDAFVYPTRALDGADEELLKLCAGRVLFDERGMARAFLQRLSERDRHGPTPLSDSEQQMRRVWARKMIARIRRGDVEAQYRRHWLLYQLLEDHFALRGVWYRGPKLAFACLLRDDPPIYEAFCRALQHQDDIDALQALVDLVSGE